MIKKEALLYEFWRLYDIYGIKDALLYLDNNGYHDNCHYEDYKNELTSMNALDNMLSNLNLE